MLFGTHAFNFNCFLDGFNCVFTQISCLYVPLAVTFISVLICAIHVLYSTLLSECFTVWNGVLFIRQGLYQEGVFKFTLTVPENYPDGDCPVSWLTVNSIPLLTLYSIMVLLTPLKYHVFENIMENGAFAPKEQMLHFP